MPSAKAIFDSFASSVDLCSGERWERREPEIEEGEVSAVNPDLFWVVASAVRSGSVSPISAVVGKMIEALFR